MEVPIRSSEDSKLLFPPSSSLSSLYTHPISMKRMPQLLDCYHFFANAHSYFWEKDHYHSMHCCMTLYKVCHISGNAMKVAVAKYAIKRRLLSTLPGGVLVVDENEVDVYLACLTFCVMAETMSLRNRRASHASAPASTY